MPTIEYLNLINQGPLINKRRYLDQNVKPVYTKQFTKRVQHYFEKIKREAKELNKYISFELRIDRTAEKFGIHRSHVYDLIKRDPQVKQERY